MNDVPRNDEPTDDIDDLYRRAAAADPSRPSDAVRRAILSQAAQQAAAQHVAAPPSATQGGPSHGEPSHREASYKARRSFPTHRSAAVGTLAAAVLAGLLVTPHFLATRNEPARIAAPVPLSPVEVTPAAPLPRAEELQPYISMQQERTAATARARAAAGKEAQVDLNAADRQATTTFSTSISAVPVPSPPPAAPAATAADTPMMAYASAPSNEVAKARSLALPAAPDSPTAGAALRRAAEQGDIQKLQSLFELGVDVNARDADDRSPLLLAVLSGRSNVIELLLTHGANVNAADRSGNTPLRAAESTHQSAIAATLRAAGAH